VLAGSTSALHQSSNIETLAGMLDTVVDHADEANSGTELFTQLAGTL
jgi:hypothetical protein